MLLRGSLVGALLAWSAGSAAGQTIWYVDDDGTPPGSGTPGDPYTSIQHAVAQPATLDGDTVLVLPGTYAECVDLLGKALVLRGEQGPSVTTVDGGGLGSVLTIPDPTSGLVVVEGLRIVNGVADGSTGPSRGGGVLCLGDQALIRGCVIEDNVAELGGGVYLGGGELRDSIVRHNESPEIGSCFFMGRGGGVYGGARIEGCQILSNVALNFGGGIDTGGLVQDCTIDGNRAQIGGGVYGGTVVASTLTGNRGWSCDDSGGGGGGASDAVLDQCLLAGNFGEDWGAGAAFSTLTDCEVRGNQLGWSGVTNQTGGAGLFSCDASDCTIADNVAPQVHGWGWSPGGGARFSTLERCVVRGNRADEGGGIAQSDARFCTIVHNQARVQGGGVFAAGAALVSSSIVRASTPQAIASLGGLTVSWSDVEGGWAGRGNIDADPRFCAPLAGDLHLKAGSPCIDAGDPAAPPDPDGSPADMGALPYDAAHCGAGCPTVYCTSEVNSQGCLPAISASGLPSFAASTFQVRAASLIPQQSGCVVWGLAPASTPFQGGTLCVAPPSKRTPLASTKGAPPPSSCSGVLVVPFTSAYLAAQNLHPGAVVYAQVWSRDPGDASATNLTDAVEFTVCQ